MQELVDFIKASGLAAFKVPGLIPASVPSDWDEGRIERFIQAEGQMFFSKEVILRREVIPFTITNMTTLEVLNCAMWGEEERCVNRFGGPGYTRITWRFTPVRFD